MKASTLFAIASACSVLLRGVAYAADAHPSSDAEPAEVHQKETTSATGKDIEKRAPAEDFSAEEQLAHSKAHGIYSFGRIQNPGLGHSTFAMSKGLPEYKHSLTFPKLPLPPSNAKQAGVSHVKSTTALDPLHRQPGFVNNLGGGAKGISGAAHQPTTSHEWHTVPLTPSTIALAHGRLPGTASLGGPIKPRNLFLSTAVEPKSKF